MRGSTTLAAATSSALAWYVRKADGHCFQIKPISRQYLHTEQFNDGQFGTIEKHADAYNGGGPAVVMERQLDRTDPDVLERYGGGDVWPLAAAWDLGEIAPNGNYLENDDIAVSHGVCGDTPQSGDDNPFVYSTPTSEWDVLETFEPGQIIEIDLIFPNYHWGHVEYFLCDTKDMDDPDGIPKQSCFNRYPLDRADDDSFNSPVDPDFPGRYYIDPPCRGENNEVDQTRPVFSGESVLNDGTVNHMRYKLPDITCEHCILMMRYHSGRGCKSPGYDEFNPPSWPSECAPNKEDWIIVSSHECNQPGREWGNLFWNCSDIAIRSSGGQEPPPAPEPTPEPEPETPSPISPDAEPETPGPVSPEAEPETPSPVSPDAEPETPSPVSPDAEPETPSPVSPDAEPGTPGPVSPDAEPETPGPVSPEAEPETPSPVFPEAEPETPSPVSPDDPTMPLPLPTGGDDCMVVIIEAEDLEFFGAWSAMPDSDASGGEYITWEGLSAQANNHDYEEGDIISTTINITSPGTYSFKFLMRQPSGAMSDRANDAWLYFSDATRFGPADSDASYGTFVKVEGNANDGGFEYSGTAEEENRDRSEIAVEFAEAGEYAMEISGRSHGFQLDQIILFGDTLDVDDAAGGCQ